MQFKYRGNTVTLTQKAVVRWGDFPAIASSIEYKEKLKEIEVLNEVNKVARKAPKVTITLRSNAQAAIQTIRKRFNVNKIYQFDYKIERKDKKLKALTALYSLQYGGSSSPHQAGKFELYEGFQSISKLDKIRSYTKQFETKIKQTRQSIRRPVVRKKTFYIRSLNTRVEYETIDGTFSQPGAILKIARELKSKQVFMSKYPANNNKHVAAEIECFGPLTLTELGVKVYEAGLAKYVHVKTDGSIRPNKSSEHPYELAVLAEASVFKDVIKRLSDLLVSLECKVNKSCGLHVHLDTRGQDANKMFSNLVSAQTILYKMQPQSRRDNSYCKPTGSKSLRIERNKGNRYLGINPMSYSRHSTIEVRLHGGTIDAVKINNFVFILERVAYHDQEIRRGASTVKGFGKQYGLPDSIVSYIDMRIAKFAGAEPLEESA